MNAVGELDMVVAEIAEGLTSLVSAELFDSVEDGSACAVHLGGELARDLVLHVDGRALRLSHDVPAAPAARVHLASDDFLRLYRGDTTLYTLLDAGKLRAEGNAEMLRHLQDILVHPSPSEVAGFAAASAAYRRNPITHVERVRRPSLDDMRAARREQRPLVMEGMVDDWAPSRWDAAAMRAALGHCVLQGVKQLNKTVAEFMDEIAAAEDGGEKPYSDHIRLPEEVRRVVGDVHLFPDEEIHHREMFLSSAGTHSSLHRDCHDGVACAVLGRRRFILFSPDQEESVYARRRFHGWQQCHLSSPLAVDLKRFPLFRESTVIDVTLRPGEALLLPFGWFHFVVAVDNSATFRWNYPPLIGGEQPAADAA